MRHVAHPHPALRAHALLLVGKLRLRRLQELRRSWSLRFRPRFNGASLGPENARANIGEGADSTTPPEEFVQSLQVGARQALTAALRVSFKRGGHEWKLMRDASLSLVMLHGGFSDENVCGVGAGIEGNRDDDVGIGHHRVENDVFKVRCPVLLDRLQLWWYAKKNEEETVQALACVLKLDFPWLVAAASARTVK